jgi:hypothetical protein
VFCMLRPCMSCTVEGQKVDTQERQRQGRRGEPCVRCSGTGSPRPGPGESPLSFSPPTPSARSVTPNLCSVSGSVPCISLSASLTSSLCSHLLFLSTSLSFSPAHPSPSLSLRLPLRPSVPSLAFSPRQKPSSPSPRARDKTATHAEPTPPARGKDSQSPRSAPSSQGRGGRTAGGEARRRRRRRRRRRSRSSASAPRRRGRRRARPAPPRGSSRSLSRAHSSSDSGGGGGAPGPGPEPGSERGHGGHGKR